MDSLNIHPRLLLGPGPSPVPYAVRRALAEPVVGHMDPQFLTIVDHIQGMLREVFGTTNRLTLPVSGTGSAGMETAIVNFVEPGDTVIVVVAGVFGRRIVQAVEKVGGHVVCLEVPDGQAATLHSLQELLDSHPKTRLVAVVMAETSTGVLQPLTGWSELVHERGAILLVDAVTSLGGMPVLVDTNGFDVVFSGTQKCLSAPPGLSPFTASDRALARLDERTALVPSWYLDLNAFRQYWGKNRVYHHTAPISMLYGLYEALHITLEEGLETRYNRHRQVASALWAGLEAMGLELMVDAAIRLPSVTTVKIPQHVDDGRLRQYLLEQNGIEIAGGLQSLSGKIWRIGVMGHGARLSNMIELLAALRRGLADQGIKVESGLEALETAYNRGIR